MAQRRVKASFNVREDIRKIKNRESLQYVNAQRDPAVPTESDTAALQESERFSWEGDQAQGDFIPLTYYPTKTSWPGNTFHHRRTIAAGYNRATGIIRIKFWTDGAEYDYGVTTPIPPYIAYAFRQTQSPGRYINSTLEGYGYSRIN